jgi:hypothetical protein
MRPVRFLLLPVVLPAALWACGHDPDPALERVQGRAMLFAEPASAPALPPAGSGIHPCPETDGTGDPGHLRGHQIHLQLAQGRP